MSLSLTGKLIPLGTLSSFSYCFKSKIRPSFLSLGWRYLQGCYGWFSSTEFLGEWQSHETKLTDPKKSLSFPIYPPAYIKLIWWEASLNSETWNSYKECACSLLWYRRMLAISAFAVSCGKKIAFIVWEVGFPQHHAIAKERKFKPVCALL